jgi:hypothetical protein
MRDKYNTVKGKKDEAENGWSGRILLIPFDTFYIIYISVGYIVYV